MKPNITQSKPKLTQENPDKTQVNPGKPRKTQENPVKPSKTKEEALVGGCELVEEWVAQLTEFFGAERALFLAADAEHAVAAAVEGAGRFGAAVAGGAAGAGAAVVTAAAAAAARIEAIVG